MNQNINIGTKNGQKNGLYIVVDIETFEYAYFPRGGMGITIGLSDLGERIFIRQDGFYISPGTENIISMDIEGYETTEAALNSYPIERFCYREEDFQPLHYNLVRKDKICIYFYLSNPAHQ